MLSKRTESHQQESSGGSDDPIQEESIETAVDVHQADTRSETHSESDYTPSSDDESEADDGRSEFAAHSDAGEEGSKVENDKDRGLPEDEDGDITMKLKESTIDDKTEQHDESSHLRQDQEDRHQIDDEEYLSELSEDEAFAASLA
jgi:hypothetical protein